LKLGVFLVFISVRVLVLFQEGACTAYAGTPVLWTLARSSWACYILGGEARVAPSGRTKPAGGACVSSSSSRFRPPSSWVLAVNGRRWMQSRRLRRQHAAGVCTQQAATTTYGTEQPSAAQGPTPQQPRISGDKCRKKSFVFAWFASHQVQVVSISLMEFRCHFHEQG
jgi:hypothetical protein